MLEDDDYTQHAQVESVPAEVDGTPPEQGALHLEATKQAILERLLPGERHVLAVAQELKIRESAIRRHFDQLEHQGLVTGFFRQEGLGRPKKYYKLTETGNVRFPKMLSDPLVQALDRLVAAGRARNKQEAVHAHLRDLATTVGAQDMPATPLAQARVLERLLTQVGLSTRGRIEGDQIVMDHTGDVVLRRALGREEPLSRDEREAYVREAVEALGWSTTRVASGRDLVPTPG